MTEKKPFYLTTTLPYVNADPHIGFALEIVQADALARFRRLMGEEVFFNTGTDEHGQKIYEAAQRAGEDVKEYVDHFASEFRKLKEALNLSNDVFVRTTDPHHVKAAQHIWKLCAHDIEKRSYKGLYCVGCEAFKTDKDLKDGHCSIHPNLEIQTLEEENYFFLFSRYQEKLLEYLSSPEVILPEWRREEAINFVKEGLQDFSISREKERLSWGIPVPGDDDQVMYVWFDALTNYISTLGWPEDSEGKFKKFWEGGETVQVAGKDQVRFQSLMWQAMLMSAGIKGTEKVVYHGFITSGGQKMSKSLGNVINPIDLVNEYGTDAVRYFLLRHVHPFEDSDVTLERFKELYNANLANGLGNLVSRIMKMSSSYLESVPEIPPETIPESFKKSLYAYQSQEAIDTVWSLIGELDRDIQERKPFEIFKTEPERARIIIREMLVRLYAIGRMLHPFLPYTSNKIKELIKENRMPESPLFLRKD